ncbi:UNVERIFIED_CONTAM: hypothetical protein Slati_2380000 [Sesamum latifolium]|uniref:Reverse transcriptase n=1 Tax=Sesamum latifolium TaxID=2727402 RepID=A0AAW2WB35_9LAMI
MKKLFPSSDIKADPHIQSKIHVWKKTYGSLVGMLGRSGFGWNDATNMVVVDDDVVWDNYIKIDPFAKNMRLKSSHSTRLGARFRLPDDEKAELIRMMLDGLATLMDMPNNVNILDTGDFNELLESTEKQGGQPRPPWQIQDLWNALDRAGLFDLGSTGDFFTWSNRQEAPHTIFERLDKACGNSSWQINFPGTKITTLSSITSDHAPILIETRPTVNRGKNSSRPFRFEASWMRTEDCERLISDAWQQPDGSNTQGQFQRNIELCKVKITQPLKKYNGNKELNLIGCEKAIETQNFFHAHANKTFRLNQIHKLKNSASVLIDKEEDIRRHITEYFGNIFCFAEPSINDLASGVEALTRRVDSNINAELMKPYTVEEITTARSLMAPLKSPGPDDMPPIFFQKYWHIIKSDVINCVLSILNDRVLDPNLNFTHIALIPKIHMPKLITHFRPISLCNVIMRITTKCIANRLKPLLDKIIAPMQSTFIRRRLITDNVLIVFEINHFIKDKTWGKTGHMALKPDISKVYDKIEWSFLRKKAPSRGSSLALPLLLCTEALSSLIARAESLGSLQVRGGEKQLSQVGKEVLIKAVIQAIPTYAMGIFRLPEGIIRDIEGGLGLRDLRAFNIAMLAKQFWRLLTNPTSLTARLIQARYYPGLSILDADLGTRPSLTWRSIFSTKAIIQVGYRWRSGDGEQTRIWIDPWIPKPPNFRPRSRMHPLLPPTMVFTWRLCTASLPLGQNLSRRIPGIDICCPLCASPDESDQHTFLLCPFSRMVWCMSDLRWIFISRWTTNARDWIFHAQRELDKGDFYLFLVIGWSIWWSRNRKWTKDDTTSPIQIVAFARNYLDAFSGFLEPRQYLQTLSALTTWTTPPPDYIKLKVDAAIFSADGDIGAGIVARTNHGSCLAWTAIRDHRLLSPEAVEAWAARIAIQFAIWHGWNRIIIETDCANLHSYLAYSKCCPPDCGPFVHDILTLSNTLQSCLFSLVRRTSNVLVHSLAKQAVGSNDFRPGLDRPVRPIGPGTGCLSGPVVKITQRCLNGGGSWPWRGREDGGGCRLASSSQQVQQRRAAAVCAVAAAVRCYLQQRTATAVSIEQAHSCFNGDFGFANYAK